MINLNNTGHFPGSSDSQPQHKSTKSPLGNILPHFQLLSPLFLHAIPANTEILHVRPHKVRNLKYQSLLSTKICYPKEFTATAFYIQQLAPVSKIYKE